MSCSAAGGLSAAIPDVVLSAVRLTEPDPLEASTEVRRLVARCLRKDPEQRFQSMRELRPLSRGPSRYSPAKNRPSRCFRSS